MGQADDDVPTVIMSCVLVVVLPTNEEEEEESIWSDRRPWRGMLFPPPPSCLYVFFHSGHFGRRSSVFR